MEKQPVYIPILSETIKDDTLIDFDIYTLEGEKYFLFCSVDSKVTKTNLSKTYLENTRYFYINKKDRPQYETYLEKHLSDALVSNSLEQVEKIDLIYQISFSLIDRIFHNDQVPEKLEVMAFTDDVLDYMFKSYVKLGALIVMHGKDKYIYSHSLHVMIYTAMFLYFLNIKDKKIMRSVCTGAFLHDIGKARIDKRILDKGSNLNTFEQNLMHQHPLYGTEIARELLDMDDLLTESIILNHHERLDGTGYPHGKTLLSKFDRIVAIVDMFDALTIDKPSQKAKTPFQALQYILLKERGAVDMTLLQHFAKMLSMK